MKPLSRRDFIQTAAAVSAATLTGSANAGAEVLQPIRPLRFGVNYVPRKLWWYCWLDWDQQAIADDLSGIAGLGMDHIRIQCLWPFFQPGISTVSERALANLHSLLDAAETAKLDVQVTVLNGWMSGLSFLPAWTAPVVKPKRAGGNIFTEPLVIEAEKLLFSRIAQTIGKHPRFMGFDIGNEMGVLQAPENNPVSTIDADAWATDILGYCDQIAPGKFHVNGTDHAHWFGDYGFSRKQLATTGHASIVHGYIYFTGVLQRYKYNDEPSFQLPAYMIELAYAYQTDLRRPVWVEEVGVGRYEMPESFRPEFLERTVRNIAATGKAWGVTWWCSHDIDPSIKSFGPYEYDLGLLDLQNKPKPAGRRFMEVANELRRSSAAVPPRHIALAIPEHGLAARSYPPDWRFATPYMNLIERGKLPAIILESRANDEAYLKARGITEVIPLPS